MARRASAREFREGTLLWKPLEERKVGANVSRYLHWLKGTRGLGFDSYEDLWQWSVSDLEAFWRSTWDFFAVKAHRPYTQVLAERRMQGACWFIDAELNYAEHLLHRRDEHTAVLARSEARPGHHADLR